MPHKRIFGNTWRHFNGHELWRQRATDTWWVEAKDAINEPAKHDYILSLRN
jgi:hypothetical protein